MRTQIGYLFSSFGHAQEKNPHPNIIVLQHGRQIREHKIPPPCTVMAPSLLLAAGSSSPCRFPDWPQPPCPRSPRRIRLGPLPASPAAPAAPCLIGGGRA